MYRVSFRVSEQLLTPVFAQHLFYSKATASSVELQLIPERPARALERILFSLERAGHPEWACPYRGTEVYRGVVPQGLKHRLCIQKVPDLPPTSFPMQMAHFPPYSYTPDFLQGDLMISNWATSRQGQLKLSKHNLPKATAEFTAQVGFDPPSSLPECYTPATAPG